MRRLIRWTSLAALTVLVLPLLHKFATQHQLYKIPPGILSTLSEYVQRVSDVPNFTYWLAFIGGLTLGTWVDATIKVDGVKDLMKK
jgi:hypothetical protein